MIRWAWLSLLAVGVYLWVGVNVIIHPDHFDAPEDGHHNQHCAQAHSPLDKLMCGHPLKKKKVLWFLFDGMAYDQAQDLREWMGARANMYKVNVDFFKQSGAIHEIYLSGKFSRNFVATTTKVDNLLWQMKYSGKRLHIYGKQYPMFSLGGYQTEQTVYEQAKVDQSFCHAYDKLLYLDYDMDYFRNWPKDLPRIRQELDAHWPRQDQNQAWTKCLDEAGVMGSRESLIHFNQIMDNFNHGFSKEQAITYAHAYQQQRLLYDLSRWVDANPEYVLVASSDHGGQLYYGQDYFCTHGCNYEGNQGMLYIYMAEFNDTFSRVGPFQKEDNTSYVPASPPSAPIDIQCYDVSMVMASVLSDVNMPLKSTAKVVPLVKDPAYILLQYRSKEVQLKTQLMNLGGSADLSSFSVYQSLQNMSSIQQMHDQYSNQFSMYIQQYQQLIDKLEIQVGQEQTKKQSKGIYLLMMVAIGIACIYLVRIMHNILVQSVPVKMAYGLEALLFCDQVVMMAWPYYSMDQQQQIGLLVMVVLNMVMSILMWRQQTKQDSSESYLRVNGSIEENEPDQPIQVMTCAKMAMYYTVVVLLILVLTHIQVSTVLKQVQPKITHLKHVDLINYILFSLLMGLLLRMIYRKFYMVQSRRVNASLLIGVYYIVMIIKMALYDYNNPRYFSHQTDDQVSRVTGVYMMMAAHVIFLVLDLTWHFKGERKAKRIESCQSVVLPMVALLYFLNDEMERLQMLGLVAGLLYTVRVFHQSKDEKVRHLVLVYLMQFSQFGYAYQRGTFSFDTSIKAGNKTMAKEQDDAPLFTGFLFGVHKFQIHLLAGVVLLALIKARRFDSGLAFTTHGILVLLGLLVKLLVGVIAHLQYFAYRVEQQLLPVFILNAGKVLTILVVVMAVLSIATVQTVKSIARLQ